MNTEIFNYNGNEITFQLGNGDVMVNATQMAKPFGKLPKDYLKTQSSKELIQALATSKNVEAKILLKVVKGQSSYHNQGTWMHEDLAIDFAQWLNVEFRLWCNDRIKEIIKHGFTATPNTLENLINNPDLVIQLATNLKNERAEKERLQLEIDTKHKPRSQFVDQVFNSDDLISISVAAKTLGLDFGRNTLYKKLREKGVLFKNSNEPKQYYVSKGYFKIKEKLITKESGKEFINIQTFVTQKGLAYIAKIFNVVQLPIQRVQISA